MDGVVMMAGEPDRPWGVIMHNCPQGDATGAEIAACTVWEGPVYAISVEGAVSWIPARGMRCGQAGERLLLPDFGAAVMQSQALQANNNASRRCVSAESLPGMIGGNPYRS
jgi:hypothetical protein